MWKLLITLLFGCVIKSTGQAILSTRDSLTYDSIALVQKAHLKQLPESYANDLFDSATIRAKYRTVLLEQQKKDPSSWRYITVDSLIKIDAKIAVYSKWQDRETYWILDKVINQLNTTNAIHSIFEKPYLPKYGTLHSKHINAASQRLNNEFVLFVNVRSLTFCWEMAKLMSQFLTYDSKGGFDANLEKMTDKIRSDTSILSEFSILLQRFYRGASTKRPALDTFHQVLYSPMATAMEFFVASHEYAHGYFEHNLPSVIELMRSPYADSLLKKNLILSWRNELIADIYAQRLMNFYVDKFAGRNELLYNRYGGLLFLAAFNILEKVNYTFVNGSEPFDINRKDPIFLELMNNINPDETLHVNTSRIDSKWINEQIMHPSISLRMSLVRAEVEKAKHQTEAPYTQQQLNYEKLAQNFVAALDYLYEYSRPLILKIAALIQKEKKD